MQTTISPAGISDFIYPDQYITSNKAKVSRISKFLNWCISQEEHRILWLALTFLGLIGTAVPCTLASILMLAGNNFTLWIIVCAVNVPVMSLSLAAQPTKITIPALFAAYAINFSVIIYCILYYLLHS